MANEALQGLARRHGMATDDRRRTVGRAYAESRVSLGEAATLLGMDASDAAAFLETYGFARSLDAIALDESRRADIGARLRTDRLARGGSPSVDETLVRRVVVASQRIEGVDARPHLSDPKT